MQPVIMPKLGLTMEEGTVIRWMKDEGESIKKGEILFEVETDKSVNEVGAPTTGKLGKILITEGETVDVLSVIGYILEKDEEAPERWPKPSVSLPTSSVDEGQKSVDTRIKATPVAQRLARELDLDLGQIVGTGQGGAITKEDIQSFEKGLEKTKPTAPRRILASPRAKRLAKEKGIPLDQVQGSGPGGRITEDDILHYVKTEDILQLNKLQKITAERMAESFSTAPHFYLRVEVDAGELMGNREEITSTHEHEPDVHITISDLIILLVAKVLQAHPMVNASWAESGIRRNPDINIGLAVAVEEGLIVPVIKGADNKSIVQIASERAELVDLAKKGKLGLQDLEGGTFTISNLGMYEVDEFTAILNAPQSAILAIGQIKDRVVVIEGHMIVKPTFWLTLTIDHRVLDGARGARFLKDLKDALENPKTYLSSPED